MLAILLVAFVAMRPLLPIDETRYLGVAWEMWQSGDLFHLTRNFESYTHKPPLLFWLINLVWSVTGVAEFPARLVGPAFGVALAVAAARFGRALWPQEAGIGSRAVMALSGFTVYLVYASTTMFDAMLAVAVLAGVAVLWRIGQGGAGRRHWLAFGAALAFGTLAKGPVIFVHLLPVFLTMRFWAPVPPGARAQAGGLGLAVAAGLAIVALWLVPALIGGTPEFRHELLWTQSAGRVAGGLAHDRPVWFLAALLPVLLFPWGWSAALWRRLGPAVRDDRAARMLALWAGSAFVLFSLISGKQAHYLLPEYAAVALLVARVLPALDTGRGWRLAAIPAIAGAAGAFAVATGLVAAPAGVPADAPGWAVPLVGLCCLALAVGVILAPRPVAVAGLGAGIAVAMHLLIVATGMTRGYDTAPVVARIEAETPEAIAVAGMTYNAEFNFAARLTEAVATPATPDDLLAWCAAHPRGLVIGPIGRIETAAPPISTIDYGGRTLGLWRAAELLSSVPG